MSHPSRPLSPELQRILNEQDDQDHNSDHDVPLTVTEQPPPTPYRYAAYATRIRTILLSAHRYVAYASDVGESFRPVAHPWLVRGAYVLSTAYVMGDVAVVGWRARGQNMDMLELAKKGRELGWGMHKREREGGGSTAMNIGGAQARDRGTGQVQHGHSETGDVSITAPVSTSTPAPSALSARNPISLADDFRTIMAERAVFQALASLILPALTVHTVVRYSGRALRRLPGTTVRTVVPVGLGLAVVPLLPFIYDKPVEEGVQWCSRQIISRLEERVESSRTE